MYISPCQVTYKILKATYSKSSALWSSVSLGGISIHHSIWFCVLNLDDTQLSMYSHFVLTQLHSSVALAASGRQSFSCACWNPHNNDCTQLLTGVDNAIKAWDLRTKE